MDLARIEKAVREILEAIGEDPDRDGLLDTPARVARMYAEIFVGLHTDPAEHLTVTFESSHDEMVMVRDIPLQSMCEHHLIPFSGKAHVAYIPGHDGRITGLSKIARLVDGYSRRPQVQEHLTVQIADAMERTLEPAWGDGDHRGRAPLHVDAGRPEGRLDHGDVRRAGALPRQHRHPPRGDALRHRARVNQKALRRTSVPRTGAGSAS